MVLSNVCLAYSTQANEQEKDCVSNKKINLSQFIPLEKSQESKKVHVLK